MTTKGNVQHCLTKQYICIGKPSGVCSGGGLTGEAGSAHANKAPGLVDAHAIVEAG